MTCKAYLTQPTAVNINLLDYGFPAILHVSDQERNSLSIFFPDQASWDEFSEAVRIFDLSLQPVDLAA